MMKRLLIGLAISFAGAAVAAAADLPVYYKAPPPPMWTWSGFYIGGNIGGKWADSSGHADMAGATGFGITTPAGSLPFSSTTSSTAIGGGQAGYNWQTGPYVLGLEGDIDAHNWHVTRTAVGPPPLPGVFIPGDFFTASSHWQASLRGRIGYAWDRTLIYATGGAAWTNVSVGTNFIATNTFPGTGASDSATLGGATVGGGIEYAFWHNVSLGVEGRYTWYGSHTYNGGTVAAISSGGATPTFVFAPATQTLSLNTAEVMGKINWRF
ncbi:MAG: outer membrane protein [Xanthobacteraceae bacterium]